MAFVTLPYPNMDFTPFDILPASDLDKMVANIETIAGTDIDGSTIVDGSVSTDKIAQQAVTTSKIDMAGLLDFVIDVMYPVGSYYETSDTTFDPNIDWGVGTWVEDTAGRVLVAQESGTFATVGGTGGEKTHKLTETEIPSHSHRMNDNTWINEGTVQLGRSSGWAGDNASAFGGKWTYNTGGNGSHNNLQPYIVVKRWHRTA